MKFLSVFKLIGAFLFALLAANVFAYAIPMDPVPLAVGIFSASLLIPKQAGRLAFMSGIEAREDFINVVRIFDNAFNPKFLFNKQTQKWEPNQAYDPLWDAVSAFRLTQQTLRMEQPMVVGTNVYNFPILNNIQNQAGQFNTEIRLAQNDTFVPTHIGFFMEYPNSGVDTTFIPRTYPNTQESAQPVQEKAYYNGVLNIMVSNVQYTSNWDLLRHYCTNQTQQTAALGAGSPEDQWDGSTDGWFPMQPFVLMIGSQNIRISITLPVAPTAVSPNGRLCLAFRGVLGQQSTVVN